RRNNQCKVSLRARELQFNVSSTPAFTIAVYVSTILFNKAAAARDLPSFPTRRSSDLDARAFATLRHPPPDPRGPAPLPVYRRRRSEEHTSELQSRGHLVCPLLLEKKKPHETVSHRTAALLRRSHASIVTWRPVRLGCA